MNIFFIASEIAPIAKVGGLGDVIFGLAKELSKKNKSLKVILPKYKGIEQKKIENLSLITETTTFLPSDEAVHVKFWTGNLQGITLIFIDPQPPYNVFQRESIYGEKDDTFRFLLFSYLSLSFLEKNADGGIIHLHDWQTAFVASFYKLFFSSKLKESYKTVLTIHNMMHQGRALFWEVEPFMIPKSNKYEDPRSPDCINLLKSGMLDAHKVTTVSKTYAEEIRSPDFSFYLDETIWQVKDKTIGILNGIDELYWNPNDKKFIPHPFDKLDPIEKIHEAKKNNKKFLEKKLNTSFGNKPLFCVISRLDHQKGPYLISQAARDIAEEGGYCLILGKTVTYEIEELFSHLSQELSQSHHFLFLNIFDENLSKLIFASSDYILIPSIFEPCGLTQMIGMRFGTIPIARKTGGLADTVIDIHDQHSPEESKTGFSFDEKSYPAFLKKINEAFILDRDQRKKDHLIKKIMEKDFSWKVPAYKYMQLYSSL